MSRHPDPEVLVVGAGPVGLVAALFLQQHGVRVAIIDMNERTTQHSYALAIHPGTLDVLDEVGVSEALVAAGRRVWKVAFYEGAERKAEVDYSLLASKHPYLLVVRQSQLERAAEEALRRKRLDVIWRHRLQAFTANDAGVQAELAELEQVATGYPVARTEWLVRRTEAMRAGYVVGADGYDSAVRRMAGIDMDDHGAGELYSVYEIEAAGDLPGDVRITLDSDLASVYWPLEEGRCRWGFQIPNAADHQPSMDRLTRLIAGRAPWFTARPTQIYWSTFGFFERRLAQTFGGGRVWLAGDAAHQAGPIGVHSMNSGLVEAGELAQRISKVLRGGPPSVLEEYARGTRESWQRLLDLSAGPRQAVRPAAGTDPWVHRSAGKILASLPASGQARDLLLAQLGLTAGLRADA